MSAPIISVENLSKRYLVGHQSAERERYTALRDVLARGARNIARKTGDLLRGRQILAGDEVEEFWALKDVSFEVNEGEVLGIIGRNGAGKSTLLKILSRITEPTRGRVVLNGRVASLLEVGTGFHPELTGRENIFLNGAILGMSRAEIRAKFDEIVDFAGVETFLDTPVKRYSSGMYVRLAFAVAAHLEPEILIVDEVLAVGDAEFQKKCLGKMGEVAKGGRTVLFVSHNMGAVRALCGKVIALDRGGLSYVGPTEAGIAQYSRDHNSKSTYECNGRATGEPTLTYASISLHSSSTTLTAAVDFEVTSSRACTASVEVRLFDELGTPFALASSGLIDPENPLPINVGTTRSRLQFDCSQLARGNYRALVRLSIPFTALLDEIKDELVFTIDSHATCGGTRAIEQAWGLGLVHLKSELFVSTLP